MTAIARRLRSLPLGVALLGLVGCGSNADSASPATAGAVLVADARYQISMESDSPASPQTLGRLRVRVETRNGWHVAPEAPAWLRLDGAAGLEFDSSEQVGPETPSTADSLVFVREFTAERTVDTVARGQVKFGLCEGDDEFCVIVKRDLELPLRIAFQPSHPPEATAPE